METYEEKFGPLLEQDKEVAKALLKLSKSSLEGFEVDGPFLDKLKGDWKDIIKVSSKFGGILQKKRDDLLNILNNGY